MHERRTYSRLKPQGSPMVKIRMRILPNILDFRNTNHILMKCNCPFYDYSHFISACRCPLNWHPQIEKCRYILHVCDLGVLTILFSGRSVMVERRNAIISCIITCAVTTYVVYRYQSNMDKFEVSKYVLTSPQWKMQPYRDQLTNYVFKQYRIKTLN